MRFLLYSALLYSTLLYFTTTFTTPCTTWYDPRRSGLLLRRPTFRKPKTQNTIWRGILHWEVSITIIHKGKEIIQLLANSYGKS